MSDAIISTAILAAPFLILCFAACACEIERIRENEKRGRSHGSK